MNGINSATLIASPTRTVNVIVTDNTLTVNLEDGRTISARRVLEVLALYPDRAELQQEYPELEEEDIQQALAFAAASLEECSLARAN